MTDDRNVRKAALARLAVATREHLPEDKRERDAFYHVYLDGLEKFSTDTFVKACLRLETALNWFPKKHELLEACQSIVRRKVEDREAQRRLPEARPQVDLTDFRKRVETFAAERRMK
jgi:hypothetical protein